MRRFLRDNGLTLAMVGLFALFFGGQVLTGHATYNADQEEHGEATVGLGDYLRTGHVVEATFENWESEFLQMGFYVGLTALLVQRGSAESKDPDGADPSDADPRDEADKPDAPGPVRRGGLELALYEHSLTIALLLMFAGSFVLHLIGGARAYSQEQLAHGQPAVSTLQFARTPQFWFESFQNWQSEFLSVAALTVLSIVLRQRGSPESKPVAAPHRQTGG